MSDWFLILTPLLVLVVVLFLGFAGCDFEHGSLPPRPSLILRARVASNLTAVGGVTFQWDRPGPTTMVEETTVTSFKTVEGESVFEHELPDTESGSWTVACRMVAQDLSSGAQQQDEQSGSFLLPNYGTWLWVFRASGRPSVDFDIKNPDGLR